MSLSGVDVMGFWLRGCCRQWSSRGELSLRGPCWLHRSPLRLLWCRGVLVPVLAGLPCCMDVVQPALALLVACSSDCSTMGAWACSLGRQSLLVRCTLWSPSSPVSLILRGSFWLPSSLVVFCWLGGGVHPAVGFEMRCLLMLFTSHSLLVRPREAFTSSGGFVVGGSSSVVGGSW